MKKWFIISGIVAALACASVAMAEPGAGRGGEGRGPHGGGPGFGGGQGPGAGMLLQRVLQNEALAKKVGLTDEQIAALKTSLHETQKQMIKLRSDVELAELEVRRLMGEDNVDRAALMQALDAAGAAQTAMRKAGADERLKLREIVGQETLDKIRALVADRVANRRGDGEGRRARGPRDDDDDEQKGPRRGEGKGPAWMQDEMPPPAE